MHDSFEVGFLSCCETFTLSGRDGDSVFYIFHTSLFVHPPHRMPHEKHFTATTTLLMLRKNRGKKNRLILQGAAKCLNNSRCIQACTIITFHALLRLMSIQSECQRSQVLSSSAYHCEPYWYILLRIIL